MSCVSVKLWIEFWLLAIVRPPVSFPSSQIILEEGTPVVMSFSHISFFTVSICMSAHCAVLQQQRKAILIFFSLANGTSLVATNKQDNQLESNGFVFLTLKASKFVRRQRAIEDD